MLAGKVALITGSTSGIGLATAHVLAEQGIHLALHGLLSDQAGAALAQEFTKQYGIKTLFSCADLRNVPAIRTFIEQAIATLGSVDILVNNAGIQHTEAIDTFPENQWNDIIAINLSAAFHTTQNVLACMKQNQWGRIINIASVHGLVASLNKSAYCAAKHGIIGLTKVVALEMAEQGITANAICPGWVDTPILHAQIAQFAEKNGLDIKQAKKDIVTQKQPIPEMMAPRQIGEFILFLCSDSARTISGASLPIDGGWTAQ